MLFVAFYPSHLFTFPNNKSQPPTESLQVIHGNICRSKLGSIGDLVCTEKEGMEGMCFAPAREEFFKSRLKSVG